MSGTLHGKLVHLILLHTKIMLTWSFIRLKKEGIFLMISFFITYACRGSWIFEITILAASAIFSLGVRILALKTHRKVICICFTPLNADIQWNTLHCVGVINHSLGSCGKAVALRFIIDYIVYWNISWLCLETLHISDFVEEPAKLSRSVVKVKIVVWEDP